MRAAFKRGLGPLVCPRPRFLILGSLPGDASIAAQQYYAHPQNQFWRILAAVFDADAPATYEARTALAAAHRIAIWDVLQEAERAGSLDTAIRNGVANDIAGLVNRHQSLQTIACNGQKAYALFMRHAAPGLGPSRREIEIAQLPSTSPAATRPFAEKVAAWRAVLRPAE